jgi:predicted ArsR family transcriptional regulator
MSKTIKQIADELGVSKTSVRKKIDNLGLRSSLQSNGNQFSINEEQEELIKTAFKGNKSETKTQTESETVSSLISILQEELARKDAQIENLQKLLDQEQQLHMHTKQQLQLLEQKEDIIEEPEPTKKKWWQFFS